MEENSEKLDVTEEMPKVVYTPVVDGLGVVLEQDGYVTPIKFAPNLLTQYEYAALQVIYKQIAALIKGNVGEFDEVGGDGQIDIRFDKKGSPKKIKLTVNIHLDRDDDFYTRNSDIPLATNILLPMLIIASNGLEVEEGGL